MLLPICLFDEYNNNNSNDYGDDDDDYDESQYSFFVYSIIVSVRETCADWQRGVEPSADPALRGKKDPDTGFGIKVPRRNVGEY